MNPKRPALKHIIIKMEKVKDKDGILKKQEVPSDCQLICNRNISSKKIGTIYLKVMKSKDLQPRVLYQARVPFKIQSQINSFPVKKS